MRSPVILIVACVVVLLGAYVASRMLVSDVPQSSASNSVDTVAPLDLQQQAANFPTDDRPATKVQEAQRAMLGPRQGPLQAVNSPPPLTHPSEAAPAPEIAPSPFQGESKELDYVESLLAETNPPLERLQSAHQVLSRCLAQEPDNKRCQTAMTAAQARLGPKVAAERQAPLPTLQLPSPQAPGPR